MPPPRPARAAHQPAKAAPPTRTQATQIPTGQPPTPQDKTRRRRWLRLLVKWGLLAAIWLGLAAALLVLWFARDLPRPDAALDAARRPSLVLQDMDGHDFASFGDNVGEALRLSDLPPALPQAVVAVEDRRFWQHGGFDWQGMARALVVDTLQRRLAQGGSTITQQVAKTLFLSNARTLRRKVQEFLLTLWLSQHFTRQEILEIWLNRVYLGSGAWGVDAAAKTYFGISARHVSLWQAALLAGLARAPSRFNPHSNQDAAMARTRQVLAAMLRAEYITAAQAAQASAAISFAGTTARSGWFADWAASEAAPLIPDGADAVLRTTLNPRLQTVAEARLAALLAGPGAASGVTQGAVVVLDAQSGAVRAMLGGGGDSGFNRAVAARRQPGSAFKPFVWLAALEAGARPDDIVLDAPLRLGRYAPADFEDHYLGQISLEQALAVSSNTASVRLLIQAGGPRKVAAVAHRLGIADTLPDNATLALGTGGVGLLELAAAYAPFFNGGWAVVPGGVRNVMLGRATLPPPAAEPRRVVAPELAAMMRRMLGAVVTQGSGRAAAVAGHEVAGKTGTTQDYRDAWFIGWVDAGPPGGEIIGVWLGNDHDQPMHNITGGSLPARLFHEIAQTLR